jgi:putative ABC transport system substrate-binding protein
MELIMPHKLPTFSATEPPIRNAGVLMGLVGSYYNVGKAVGSLAEQVLVQKKKPSEIPVNMLPSFTFLVNRKAADNLNFQLPDKMKKYATFIE